MKIIEIKKKIRKDLKENNLFFKHKNLIIVGENGSGKSSLLKDIIKKTNDTRVGSGKIYFIDSTNRKIISNTEN